MTTFLVEKAQKHGPEVAAFIAVYGFLFTFCTPDLIFSTTTLTGGDSASWLQPMEHMRNVLIPSGRVFGWSLSNFFGYNEGQYYFPVPFLSGALLSYAIPSTVALKIVTLLGVFALPAAFYFSARRLFSNRGVQLLAPALALVFLCNESYTMFGGNFLSTLAGEFCYSWALAFFVFFLGSAWKALAKGGNPVPAGALLALVSLSHTFVFLVAFLMPFVFAFVGKDRGLLAKTASRLLVIYGLALALSAFWLLPMVGTRVWAQSIPMFWSFPSFEEFLRQTLFPVMVVAVMVCLWALRYVAHRKLAGFLLFGLGACAFLYVSSSFLEVPDIRFVPPALVLSAFALLFLAQTLADRKKPLLNAPYGKWLGAGLFAVCLVGAFLETRNLSSWFRWNYSGYEAKKEAAVLDELRRNFSGGPEAGRFLWEKPDQLDSGDFGSERVFENLTLFTGRGTSEGIHYGSSFMARASTYLQSEYSVNPVDPEADRVYSVVNPEVWPLRFSQLNARDIITFSDTIKAQFSSHKEFTKVAEYGKFVVYRYRGFSGRYIEVLPEGALSLVADSSAGFKTDLYRAFRDYELVSHPFVPLSFADKELRAALGQSLSYDSLLALHQNTYDWKAWQPDHEPISVETVEDLSIRFTTAAIGKPHLIKVSYSPQFVSLSGEKIYPVSPGFMLIYPSRPNVEIRFERSSWELAGGLITLLAFPFAFWLLRNPERRFPWPRVFQVVAMAVFFSCAISFLVLSLSGTRRLKVEYATAATLAFKSPAKNVKSLALLAPLTHPSVVERYDNQLVANALLLEARLFAATGNKAGALTNYQTLATRYRHSRMVEGLQEEMLAAGVR